MPLTQKQSQIVRIVVPLFIVGVFLAVIFLKPGSSWFGKLRGTALTPEESRQLNDEGKSLFVAGKYQEALTPLLRLNKAYPDNHIYLEQLAQTYDHLGRYKEEAEYWEKYMDHAPTPLQACPGLGQAYAKQGEAHQKQAMSAFERCLALDPNNTDSIFYLAHFLEADQPDRAAELYARGLKLVPTYADLRLGLARIWYRQDKTAEAKQAAEQVLARNPNYQDALLLMGMMYYKENNYAQAKAYLQRGTAVGDTYLDFHVLLARIAEDEKNIPEAIKQYTRLAQLKPDEPRYRSKLDTLSAKK